MIPNNELLRIDDSFKVFISSNFFSKLVSWFSYNVCFCKAAVFVSGLVFSHKIVDFAVLNVLISYFTESSDYDLKKAAAFVNIQEGLSASLVIVFIYISHAFLGRFIIIICSTVSYLGGLILLFHTALDPESKSDLFSIIGVVLLAVGEAGVKTFLEAFLADQFRAHEPEACENEDRVLARKRVWWFFACCCSVLTAFVFISYYSWPNLFMFSTKAMGSSLIVLLCGACVYHSHELPGLVSRFTVSTAIKAAIEKRNLEQPTSTDQFSADDGNQSYVSPQIKNRSRFTVFRVVKAAIQKRNLEYPTSSDQFFGNDRIQLYVSRESKIVRWLYKAAIIESNLSSEEQEKMGRLCTVREVEGIKLLLKMVPMWTTFLVFGLVVSTGTTFFPEQGNNMDSPVNITLVLIVPSISRKIRSYLSNLLISKWEPKDKKNARIIKIWAGMVLAIFCCSVAWRVEVQRLKIVNDNGLLDKPGDLIPMSIFWLVPQFCLLGLMKGVAMDGLNEFVIDEFPKSMEDYVAAINEFVVGIGSFLNILCVHVNRSLFSSTLNHSRLDKYYKTLTVVSFINLLYFLFISTMYNCSEDRGEVDEILETYGADAKV